MATAKKPTYGEMLKDPRWQQKRLRKLEAACWRCQSCMDHETMLSVHHKAYVKGRKPWEYDDEELIVLCQPCHENQHEWKERRNALIARLDLDGPMGIDDFFAFGAGAMHPLLVASDPILDAITSQILDDKPLQFACGRLAYALCEHLCELNIDGGLGPMSLREKVRTAILNEAADIHAGEPNVIADAVVAAVRKAAEQ